MNYRHTLLTAVAVMTVSTSNLPMASKDSKQVIQAAERLTAATQNISTNGGGGSGIPVRPRNQA